MQYILTEDEFNTLSAEPNEIAKQADKVIMSLCIQVANNKPIVHSYRDENNKVIHKPWRCIKSVDYEHYCDECPVNNVCPEPNKEWSK